MDERVTCPEHPAPASTCPLCCAIQYIETLKIIAEDNAEIVTTQTEVIIALLDGRLEVGLERLRQVRKLAARGVQRAKERCEAYARFEGGRG
jgi:hypothetical protein